MFTTYDPKTAGEGESDTNFVWPELPEGYYWQADWEDDEYYGRRSFVITITRHSHHRSTWTPWKTTPCTCSVVNPSKLFTHDTDSTPDLTDYEDTVQYYIDRVRRMLDAHLATEKAKAKLANEMDLLTRKYRRTGA